MEDTIRWIIGLGLSLVGVGAAAYWRLYDMLHKESDILHSRINNIRDKYVRRDDNEKSFARIDKKLERMEEKQDKQLEATQNLIRELVKRG